jgi:hypothetical protein
MGGDLYARLLGYAADQSKSKLKRFSLGETVRSLVTSKLDELGYQMAHEEMPRIERRA